MTLDAFIFFVAGVVLGALCSWLITHRYYLIASKDQRNALASLAKELEPKNTLKQFEKHLSEEWMKSNVGNCEIWQSVQNNIFQIEVSDSDREFTEPWTKNYPNPNSTAFNVYLKIAGVVISELTFVSIDGGRIFVPITRVRQTSSGDREFFWNMNSLEIKVCRIIGHYNTENSIEGVARRSKITLVD
jgi:hypothetical protein